MAFNFKFELKEDEKTSGFAPELMRQLIMHSNLVAHGNQNPEVPLSRLNYSQGMYAEAALLIKALEAAGVQCPTR